MTSTMSAAWSCASSRTRLSSTGELVEWDRHRRLGRSSRDGAEISDGVPADGVGPRSEPEHPGQHGPSRLRGPLPVLDLQPGDEPLEPLGRGLRDGELTDVRLDEVLDRLPVGIDRPRRPIGLGLQEAIGEVGEPGLPTHLDGRRRRQGRQRRLQRPFGCCLRRPEALDLLQSAVLEAVPGTGSPPARLDLLNREAPIGVDRRSRARHIHSSLSRLPARYEPLPTLLRRSPDDPPCHSPTCPSDHLLIPSSPSDPSTFSSSRTAPSAFTLPIALKPSLFTSLSLLPLLLLLRVLSPSWPVSCTCEPPSLKERRVRVVRKRTSRGGRPGRAKQGKTRRQTRRIERREKRRVCTMACTARDETQAMQ